MQATGSAFYYQKQSANIINNLLIKLAWAILGIFGPQSWQYDSCLLGLYCLDLGPIFPGAQLVIGYCFLGFNLQTLSYHRTWEVAKQT